MIDFTGIKDRSPWCVRWAQTTPGDIVIPPARRADGTNQAGSNYTYREQGQLILLGVVGRIATGAVTSGVTINQRVGASSDTPLLRFEYPTAGTYYIDHGELWVPLSGPVYDSPAVDAGRLYASVLGTVSTLDLLMWGVWCDNKEHREVTIGSITIRP